MLYREQFETSYDFPEKSDVKQHYIICYTPRSGSHLIGHTMHQKGLFGFPLEYFNPGNLPEWSKRFDTESVLDTYEMIKRYRTSPNGYFGCKLNYRNIKTLIREFDINTMFPNAKYIFIRRRNLLGQSVSLAKAWSTGSFISAVKSDITPEYDQQRINRAMELIARENACLEIFLARRGLTKLDIYYEDFLAAPDETINTIAEFLGVDTQNINSNSKTSLPEKQSDNLNGQWKQQFLDEISKTDYSYEQELLEQAEPSILSRFSKLISRSIGGTG